MSRVGFAKRRRNPKPLSGCLAEKLVFAGWVDRYIQEHEWMEA